MKPQSADNSPEESLSTNIVPEVEMTETTSIPRSLAYYPDPILLLPAVEMEKEEITDEFREGLSGLFELMYKHGGMGLAAPQVSISKRFFLLNQNPDILPREINELVFINPRLVSTEGMSTDIESCLSCPGVSATVTRAAKVTIGALNRYGEPFEQTFEGYPARAVQHEMDHLEGRVIVDYLTPAEEGFQKAALNRLDRYRQVLDNQMDRIAPKRKVVAKPRKRKGRVKKH